MSLTAVALACLLLPSATLRGKVIDSTDLAGIAGAQVELSGTAQAETVTGPDGSFQVAIPSYGKYVVEARKPGYTAAQDRDFVPVFYAADSPVPASVTIELHRPGTVRGTVVSETDGRPLSGFRVQPYRCIYIRGHRLLLEEMRSGEAKYAAGTFELHGLPPGEYVLDIGSGNSRRMRWPNGDPDYVSGVRLTAGADLDLGKIKIPEVQFASVTVEVFAPDCENGRHYRIVAAEMMGLGPIGSGAAADASCPSPRAILKLPPGKYQMYAEEANEELLPAAGSAVLELSGHDEKISIQPQRLFAIRGRVLLAETAGEESLREAVKDLSIGLATSFPGSFVSRGGGGPGKVNPDGTFNSTSYPTMEGGLTRLQIWGLPTGYFVKEVSYNGTIFPGCYVSIDAHSQEHKLQVTISGKSGALHGSVRDSSGDPVSRAKVLLAPWPAEVEAGYPAEVFETQTDAKGEFSYRGLNPMMYKALAVRSAARPRLEEPGRLIALLADARTVTLQPGTSTSAELTLSEQ